MLQVRAEIERIRDRLPEWRNKGLNEAQTCQCIIDPVLQALGWNIKDPNEVRRSHKVIVGSYVDYAFFTDNRLRMLLEAKAVGDPLTEKTVAQVLGYCGKASCQWGVVTDGIRWHLYDAFREGSLGERLWMSVSIETRHSAQIDIESLADALLVLSRESVSKGQLHERDRLVLTPHERVVQEDSSHGNSVRRISVDGGDKRSDENDSGVSADTASTPAFLRGRPDSLRSLYAILRREIVGLGNDIGVDGETTQKQIAFYRNNKRTGRFCRIRCASDHLTVMLANVIEGESGWGDLPPNVEWDLHDGRNRPRLRVESRGQIEQCMRYVRRAYGKVSCSNSSPLEKE